MARVYDGVVSFRTSHRSIYCPSDYAQSGGEVTVSYDPEVRLEYLLKVRVESVLEEFNEMPSDETITRWREQIRSVLENSNDNN